MNQGSPHAPGQRPRIWVNCAISLDGKLALAGGARARLSGPEDLERVQRLRAESDGILVGVGTVLLDDPSLRVHWELLGRPSGAGPTRIVLDSAGRLPATARVLDGSQPTIVAVSEGSRRNYPSHVERLVCGGSQVDLPRLFGELARRGMRQVLVEGGARVLREVLTRAAFDRFTVYIAPVLIGDETAPSLIPGAAAPRLEDAYPLGLVGWERMGEGLLVTFVPRAAPASPNP